MRYLIEIEVDYKPAGFDLNQSTAAYPDPMAYYSAAKSQTVSLPVEAESRNGAIAVMRRCGWTKTIENVIEIPDGSSRFEHQWKQAVTELRCTHGVVGRTRVRLPIPEC